MAHTIEGAALFGVEEKKLAAVWEYQSNSLYTEAERVALDFAFAASVVPNAVTDESFEDLRKHWSEEQIVEIVATIAMFGFLNRWNDTMGTPLEDNPMVAGDKYLARGGWESGASTVADRRLVLKPARPCGTHLWGQVHRSRCCSSWTRRWRCVHFKFVQRIENEAERRSLLVGLLVQLRLDRAIRTN